MAEWRLGHVVVTALPGWSEIQREPERLVVRSADGREQATFSFMKFSQAPSPDDFKLLCERRLAVERHHLADGFVQELGELGPAPGRLTFLFFGGDRAAGRVFAGYLLLSSRTLVTIYVEGVGTPPASLMESYKALVTGARILKN